MLRKTKPIKRKSNPEWLDKLLGKKPRARDAITISVNDGDIILSGRKFVELGKEFNDIIENKLKDLKIEFVPLTGKGKRYNLNRTAAIDNDRDTDMETAIRALRRRERT